MERSKTPTLRDIQPEDLRKPSRLEELYRQAVKAKWIEHSEANIGNFACAALRATRSGGRVGAIFAAIVRKRLWHHITQEQETHALAVLNRFRENHPEAFLVDEPPVAPVGKPDPRISVLISKVLAHARE
jgi:hypothetical protein